jgi:hypothetical protein
LPAQTLEKSISFQVANAWQNNCMLRISDGKELEEPEIYKKYDMAGNEVVGAFHTSKRNEDGAKMVAGRVDT